MANKESKAPNSELGDRKNKGRNPKYDEVEEEIEGEEASQTEEVDDPMKGLYTFNSQEFITSTQVSQATPRKKLCLSCKKGVGKTDKAILCDGCEEWVHIQTGNRRGCVDHRMTKELYEAVKEDDGECENVKYQCNHCQKENSSKKKVKGTSTAQVFRELEALSEKCGKMEISIKETETKYRQCEEENENLKQKVKEAEMEKEKMEKTYQEARQKIIETEEESEREKEIRRMKKQIREIEEKLTNANLEKEKIEMSEDRMREMLMIIKEENTALKKRMDLETQENLKIIYDKMEEVNKKRKIENFKQTEEKTENQRKVTENKDKNREQQVETRKLEKEKVEKKHKEKIEENPEKETVGRKEETRNEKIKQSEKRMVPARGRLQTKDCWHFLRGHCNLGKWCTFRHPALREEENDETRQQRDEGKTRKIRESTMGKNCWNALNGHCRRGKWCRYKHPEEEQLNKEESIECRYYKEGKCMKGRNCKFLHQKRGNCKPNEKGNCTEGSYVTEEQKRKEQSTEKNEEKERRENFQKGKQIVLTKLIQRVEDIWKEMKALV